MIASSSVLAPARRLARLSCVACLAWLACPATAWADPPATPVSPPSEEQVQSARVPYHEARELHRQGRLKEALERALEAYWIASTPVTALEAGQLLVEGGRLVEARDIVRSVAAFPVSPRESDKGREARQGATALGTALDARIPKIAIAGRATGMDVALDGKPLAASDPTAWLGVDPGAHAVVVRAGDRTCATINVTLAEAESRTIDLRDAASACRKELALPPPTPASAESVAPQPAPAPPPSATKPETTAPATGSPPGNGWRWAGIAIAGAGAVAVGVGGGIALAAKGSYDSVASQCPADGCTASGYSVRQSARSQADVATGIMIGGAVAAAGGLLLVVFTPSSGSGSDVGHPVVGVGLGNVRIAVRFP